MLKKWILTCALLLPALSFASPPKMLTVERTVSIDAPATAVWEASKSFDGLPSWHPGFSKDEIVKGKNNTAGAVRQLTIKDGPSFTEQLTRFNEKSKSFSYKIVESPLPIVAYHSTFKVISTGKNTSKVVWTGHFKRKNTTDNPPKGEGDADVIQLITGVYDGGLNNLKSQLEAK
ncbi:SRPBCC family protein [Limnobacter sp.]|uniref:SRPBCC family protein n=1 Tax=Limnobacter sp. TaxID=2003368 RepID=UPI002E300220|nr:SRPBCC family protein [Limnobacter sp.]